MGSPLRILHVVVNMNRGGAETLLMNLYRNIDRTKIQFDFLTSKEGVFDEEIKVLGGKVYRIPYLSEVGPFNYIKALNHFFNNHNDYKVVHSHMDKMSGLVLRAAHKAGIPNRLAHSHNTRSEGGFPTRMFKWYAGNQISKYATRFFACSSEASKWLFGSRFTESLILKNGIDCQKYVYSTQVRNQVLSELNIKRDSFIIGHIGRFNHQKNHTFLIDIFNEVLKSHSQALLLLVGDGSLKETIVKKVEKLGIEDKVKFLGVRSDVNKIIQAFDVMVFPSLHEGLPVTLVEAQGAGVPCIISDTITNEVDMGAGLITYESINSPLEIWANKINEKHQRDKRDSSLYIKRKGYDIKKTASWLQDLYEGIGNKNDKEKQDVI